MLSTRVGMGGLLAGKWLYLTLLGMVQLGVMFLWGRLAFKLDLFPHLPGFLIMTLFTAMAAAGFGLMLATLARTRAQLSGMSTIIILTMSSMGGSMFPRFLMSETMQKFGLLTFNAWALDGYLKVFWRNAPLWQLWPQLLVLGGSDDRLHDIGAHVRASVGDSVGGRRKTACRSRCVALNGASPRCCRQRAGQVRPRSVAPPAASRLPLFGQPDTEPLGHPIQRSAVDAEDFRGPRPVAADLIDDVEEVATLQLVERRQVDEQAFFEVGSR